MSVSNRRGSVPFDVYTPQHSFGYHPGPHTIQGLPLMAQGQYQPQMQPTMPGMVAHRHTSSLTTPPTTGGALPGSPFPPHIDQGMLTVPGVGHNGGSRDRARRSNPRDHPYQHSDARRPSWTRDSIGQMSVATSPFDPSLVALSSQTRLDDSGSATSPGADSDFYLSSIPNTPADTTGTTPEDKATLVRAHGFRLCLT